MVTGGYIVIQKKRFILKIILFSLCAQPIQLQAVNFSFLTNVISGWIENNQEKLPMIGAAVLMCAFFGYLIVKKKSNVADKLEPNKRYKIDVMQQVSLQCGYHALKNALLCYEINQFHEPISFVQESQFKDSKHYSQLFVEWEKFIVKLRKKEALKEWIQKDILQYLPEPQATQDLNQNKINELIYNEHKSKLQNTAAGIASDAINALSDSDSPEEYTVVPKMIKSCMEYNANEICQTIMQSTQFPEGCLDQIEAIKAQIKDLKKHIPTLDSMQYKITREQIRSLFNKKYPINFNDNLDGDEIKKLLYHKTNLEKVRNHFTIVDDINQLAVQENFDTAQIAWQDPQCTNYLHCFIIGTMNEKDRLVGHWFTLAVQKLDGHKYYFTADSMGTDRRNDSRVNKIIELLEGSSNNLD